MSNYDEDERPRKVVAWPLVVHETTSNGSKTDVLWPLIHYSRQGAHSVFHIRPFLFYLEKDANSYLNLVVLGFIYLHFKRSSSIFTFFLPLLYAHLVDIISQTDRTFCLGPLIVLFKKWQQLTYFHIFPLFFRHQLLVRAAYDNHGLPVENPRVEVRRKLFISPPLFFRVVWKLAVPIAPPEPRYADVWKPTIDHYSFTFFLPLFWKHSSSKGKALHIWPFYSFRWEYKKYREWGMLYPFFRSRQYVRLPDGHGDVPQDQPALPAVLNMAYHVPWPLFKVVRKVGYTSLRLLPLFWIRITHGVKNSGFVLLFYWSVSPTHKTWGLFPLFHLTRRLEPGQEHLGTYYIFPFVLNRKTPKYNLRLITPFQISYWSANCSFWSVWPLILCKYASSHYSYFWFLNYFRSEGAEVKRTFFWPFAYSRVNVADRSHLLILSFLYTMSKDPYSTLHYFLFPLFSLRLSETKVKACFLWRVGYFKMRRAKIPDSELDGFKAPGFVSGRDYKDPPPPPPLPIEGTTVPSAATPPTTGRDVFVELQSVGSVGESSEANQEEECSTIGNDSGKKEREIVEEGSQNDEIPHSVRKSIRNNLAVIQNKRESGKWRVTKLWLFPLFFWFEHGAKGIVPFFMYYATSYSYKDDRMIRGKQVFFTQKQISKINLFLIWYIQLEHLVTENKKLRHLQIAMIRFWPIFHLGYFDYKEVTTRLHLLVFPLFFYVKRKDYKAWFFIPLLTGIFHNIGDSLLKIYPFFAWIHRDTFKKSWLGYSWWVGLYGLCGCVDKLEVRRRWCFPLFFSRETFAGGLPGREEQGSKVCSEWSDRKRLSKLFVGSALFAPPYVYINHSDSKRTTVYWPFYVDSSTGTAGSDPKTWERTTYFVLWPLFRRKFDPRTGTSSSFVFPIYSFTRTHRQIKIKKKVSLQDVQGCNVIPLNKENRNSLGVRFLLHRLEFDVPTERVKIYFDASTSGLYAHSAIRNLDSARLLVADSRSRNRSLTSAAIPPCGSKLAIDRSRGDNGWVTSGYISFRLEELHKDTAYEFRCGPGFKEDHVFTTDEMLLAKTGIAPLLAQDVGSNNKKNSVPPFVAPPAATNPAATAPSPAAMVPRSHSDDFVLACNRKSTEAGTTRNNSLTNNSTAPTAPTSTTMAADRSAMLQDIRAKRMARFGGEGSGGNASVAEPEILNPKVESEVPLPVYDDDRIHVDLVDASGEIAVVLLDQDEWRRKFEEEVVPPTSEPTVILTLSDPTMPLPPLADSNNNDVALSNTDEKRPATTSPRLAPLTLPSYAVDVPQPEGLTPIGAEKQRALANEKEPVAVPPAAEPALPPPTPDLWIEETTWDKNVSTVTFMLFYLGRYSLFFFQLFSGDAQALPELCLFLFPLFYTHNTLSKNEKSAGPLTSSDTQIVTDWNPAPYSNVWKSILSTASQPRKTTTPFVYLSILWFMPQFALVHFARCGSELLRVYFFPIFYIVWECLQHSFNHTVSLFWVWPSVALVSHSEAIHTEVTSVITKTVSSYVLLLWNKRHSSTVRKTESQISITHHADKQPVPAAPQDPSPLSAHHRYEALCRKLKGLNAERGWLKDCEEDSTACLWLLHRDIALVQFWTEKSGQSVSSMALFYPLFHHAASSLPHSDGTVQRSTALSVLYFVPKYVSMFYTCRTEKDFSGQSEQSRRQTGHISYENSRTRPHQKSWHDLLVHGASADSKHHMKQILDSHKHNSKTCQNKSFSSTLYVAFFYHKTKEQKQSEISKRESFFWLFVPQLCLCRVAEDFDFDSGQWDLFSWTFPLFFVFKQTNSCLAFSHSFFGVPYRGMFGQPTAAGRCLRLTYTLRHSEYEWKRGTAQQLGAGDAQQSEVVAVNVDSGISVAANASTPAQPSASPKPLEVTCTKQTRETNKGVWYYSHRHNNFSNGDALTRKLFLHMFGASLGRYERRVSEGGEKMWKTVYALPFFWFRFSKDKEDITRIFAAITMFLHPLTSMVYSCRRKYEYSQLRKSKLFVFPLFYWLSLEKTFAALWEREPKEQRTKTTHFSLLYFVHPMASLLHFGRHVRTYTNDQTSKQSERTFHIFPLFLSNVDQNTSHKTRVVGTTRPAMASHAAAEQRVSVLLFENDDGRIEVALTVHDPQMAGLTAPQPITVRYLSTERTAIHSFMWFFHPKLALARRRSLLEDNRVLSRSDDDGAEPPSPNGPSQPRTRVQKSETYFFPLFYASRKENDSQDNARGDLFELPRHLRRVFSLFWVPMLAQSLALFLFNSDRHEHRGSKDLVYFALLFYRFKSAVEQVSIFSALWVHPFVSVFHWSKRGSLEREGNEWASREQKKLKFLWPLFFSRTREDSAGFKEQNLLLMWLCPPFLSLFRMASGSKGPIAAADSNNNSQAGGEQQQTVVLWKNVFVWPLFNRSLNNPTEGPKEQEFTALFLAPRVGLFSSFSRAEKPPAYRHPSSPTDFFTARYLAPLFYASSERVVDGYSAACTDNESVSYLWILHPAMALSRFTSEVRRSLLGVPENFAVSQWQTVVNIDPAPEKKPIRIGQIRSSSTQNYIILLFFQDSEFAINRHQEKSLTLFFVAPRFGLYSSHSHEDLSLPTPATTERSTYLFPLFFSSQSQSIDYTIFTIFSASAEYRIPENSPRRKLYELIRSNVFDEKESWFSILFFCHPAISLLANRKISKTQKRSFQNLAECVSSCLDADLPTSNLIQNAQNPIKKINSGKHESSLTYSFPFFIYKNEKHPFFTDSGLTVLCVAPNFGVLNFSKLRNLVTLAMKQRLYIVPFVFFEKTRIPKASNAAAPSTAPQAISLNDIELGDVMPPPSSPAPLHEDAVKERQSRTERFDSVTREQILAQAWSYENMSEHDLSSSSQQVLSKDQVESAVVVSVLWFFFRQMAVMRLRYQPDLKKFIIFPIFKFEKKLGYCLRWSLLPLVPVKYHMDFNLVAYEVFSRRNFGENASADKRRKYLRILYRLIRYSSEKGEVTLEVNPLFYYNAEPAKDFRRWAFIGGLIGRQHTRKRGDQCTLCFCLEV